MLTPTDLRKQLKLAGYSPLPLDMPLQRGRIHHTVYQHDDRCAYFNGDDCNCNVTVSLRVAT
jgi:hypothetical protein